VIRIKKDMNEKNLEEISEIKKYFSRIFTVFPKEIRDRLKDLDIPKEKKKILKKELAFLSKENQFKYLDEIYRLYN
jgi:hypothetical protein